MEENVKAEAKRLYKKFGNLAAEVAKEIKDYDQNDAYFWDCVISEIYKMN